MANTIILKRRIGSVKSTKQITKAMELVAASKMRRAQEYALAGRTYREFAYSLLTRLSAITEVAEHSLFVQRPVKSRTYIVITSNGTLAGAYNANILRMLSRAIIKDEKDGVKTEVIAIGKQGAKFARRVSGIDMVAAYTEFPDHPSANDIRPILNSVTELYRNKATDDVQVYYTQFKSQLTQTATALPLLPARFDATEESAHALDNTTFEPSIEAVLDSVTDRLLEVQIWQALLES
jgi:F-type H+-transporting ATPase subunit gamma